MGNREIFDVDSSKRRSKGGFSLLELIIVVSILAVILTALILVIDPLRLLARAWDGERISAAETLEDALEFVKVESGGPEGGYDPDGTNTDGCRGESAQTVYVSVPLDNGESDPNNLPQGWSYGRVTEANIFNTNGSGWIPIDMTIGGGQPPVERLPVDPANTFASGFYYSYVCARRGDFEITMRMDADKNQIGGSSDISSTDGGDDALVHEVGTDLSLNPKSPIGYWPFEEGAGMTTLDASLNSNDGTFVGDPTWQSGANCINGSCLLFDGTADRVELGNSAILRPPDMSIIAWANPTTLDSWNGIYSNMSAWGTGLGLHMGTVHDISSMVSGAYLDVPTLVPQAGSWYQVAVTHESTGGDTDLYVDGSYQNQINQAVAFEVNAPTMIGVFYTSPSILWKGTIDEVLVYDRKLSSAEIDYNYQSLKR